MIQSKKYKVIIVDDHIMFRDGLKSLIEQENIGEVIAEAENGKQFLELLEKHKPDLVLMDIEMPEMNGLEATEKAMAKYPDLKILVLSMFGYEDYYLRLINAGAKGFILKTSGKRELEQGIREVTAGESHFSNELLRRIIFNIGKAKSIQDQNTGTEAELTERELGVLKLLCNGLSTAEIAETMRLSPKTIETHRSKLLQKTGIKNSISLVLYALKNKIIEI
jgi:DNA-binding NarL/FixJ family response regulator